MEFGPFRLDTVSHRLWRGDERVSVTPKAFDLLRYRDRAPRPGDRPGRDPRCAVASHARESGGRQKHILEIRKALGDRTRPPVFIENFPKRGYQFVAAVRDMPVGAHLGPNLAAPATIVGR